MKILFLCKLTGGPKEKKTGTGHARLPHKAPEVPSAWRDRRISWSVQPRAESRTIRPNCRSGMTALQRFRACRAGLTNFASLRCFSHLAEVLGLVSSARAGRQRELPECCIVLCQTPYLLNLKRSHTHDTQLHLRNPIVAALLQQASK